jgi:hypothetical protein
VTPTILPVSLYQRWVHSHEEDTASEMVFRPASYPFPRSRGRMEFELRADQRLLKTGIAPTDGRSEMQGGWRAVGGEDEPLRLELTTPDGTQVLHVSSVDAAKLVVRKA